MIAEPRLPGMVGEHPRMLEVYRQVRCLAPSELPVLIVGETGTGKELVAKALHDLGTRARGPFVAINCAALPDGLAEAELFGWERGAFTGAVARARGLLEEADGGSLYLDEVCSMPLPLQAKLLRVVEEKAFRRVGGRISHAARFRVIASMSDTPEHLVAHGRVRLDLAHRLAGATVGLPPLRARRSDIDLLAYHFWTACGGLGALDAGLARAMRDHTWPGNVRELRTAIERFVLFRQAGIGPDGVIPQVARTSLHGEALIEAVERAGSLRAAARALGMSRTTLRRRLDALGCETIPLRS